MADCCCSQSKPVMILACSGGSNVGQATNQAAVELTREGVGKMFCLAGIGGGLQSFVQAVRDAGPVVVLDGCAVGCAKAIMENAGLKAQQYLVATDLGIEKVKDQQLLLLDEDVQRIKQSVHAGCCLGAA